ncbi:type II 3-dehydroquinate dehydratase [Alkaliphilus pronyensis]|uniref:3-dehydroquinate dehydratase n=1 Tax=Alkaliphilus pronyensis TaxID=1482732 RepID=A0A6I0F389_9FIRM|nr:type II 3-dehydroquinate dehydratase [Alkaliphilus pronyensis]KAB3537371.1 type II 3-dehydroquinate dehydratase [Alkaliphilus pronyensis]
MEKYLVIHGPSLNLLGAREPHIYGNLTLDEINNKLYNEAEKYSVEMEIVQSNSEGEIIDLIHKNSNIMGIIINPAAYTHYSYAILDAIRAVKTPVVEVHISNIHARDSYRCKSVTAEACIGIISGFGFQSYILAFYSLLANNGKIELGGRI